MSGWSVAELQRLVKGTSAPAPWDGHDFLASVEILHVDLTLLRDGFAPTLVCHAEDCPRFQIAIRISADGSHAVQARPARAVLTHRIGVHAELPAILRGVAANSGAGSAHDSAAPPPEDDDTLLEACAEIYELTATSPRVPRAATAWLRRLEYHLQRLHDAIPVADDHGPPRLRTFTDRWRLSLCAIGAKMEFLLLMARAERLGLGAYWASSLAAALQDIRPLFPPADDVGFRAWDPKPLLRQIRVATAAPTRRAAVQRPTTACGLADAGRIAASRLALKGLPSLPRPQPTQQLRDALNLLHPQPDDHHAPAIDEADFDDAAADIAGRMATLPLARRVTPESLHHSALRMRGATAPGPDGWSGDMVRRAAKLFPTSTTALLGRYFLALRDTRDPLLAQTLLDAVMLAFLKPAPAAAAAADKSIQANRLRPISIAGAFARCILAKAVSLSRKRLRDMLDPLGQYALTGTARPVAALMGALASCTRAGAPAVLTRADIINAFGSASQSSLLSAIRRTAAIAPELAALSLRAQCSTRAQGAVELLLRGDYGQGEARLAVQRGARGGAQGPPDMPAAFAIVMAEVDEEAARRAGDDVGGTSSPPATVGDAAGELWALFRQARPALPNAPPGAWTAALGTLLGEPRSATCVTTLYADDAHSAGYFYTAIRRTLWRIICGRSRGLVEAPHKCGLLCAPRWRGLLEELIAPLRGDNPDAWPILDSMKVLGVTFTNPADAVLAHHAVVESLSTAVVAPIRLLVREIGAGERKSTALFLLHRYILPVLTYHQGAWGLLAAPEAWREVDDALDELCAALCPLDIDRGALQAVRPELALPCGGGGLGIPVAAAEAPLRAAGQWSRAQALGAGARAELVSRCYRRKRTFGRENEWAAVSLDTFHKEAAAGLRNAARGAVKRRLEQNAMRGGTRAFAAVPWRSELSIDNAEFDVAWRLAFGGVPQDMARRIDAPEHGFRWRGERMEWAFAEAVRDCLPPGSVVTGAKPAPELQPPGAAAAPGECADVDVLTRTGKRLVFDVRTVNVLCASARTSPEAHCAAIEADKNRHYRKYYRSFAPFVTTLSGAVPEASAKALMGVTREVAKGDRSVLDWEPARWVESILHRLAVEMIKTMTIVATRVVLPPVHRRVTCDVP